MESGNGGACQFADARETGCLRVERFAAHGGARQDADAGSSTSSIGRAEGDRSGRQLYLRKAQGTILLLGAIRSADQCVKCHGGERGDLLGAFSYRLAREY